MLLQLLLSSEIKPATEHEVASYQLHVHNGENTQNGTLLLVQLP